MDINATLFGQMITFAIFVWFTMKYVWPVLEKMLKERQTKIAEGLYAAERGHKELELAKKEAAKELRETRLQITKMIEQAHKQAGLIIEQAKEEGNQAKEKILTLGKAELEQMRSSVQNELKNKVVDLTILGVEKILRRAINDDDQKFLLDLNNKEAGLHG